MSNERPTFSQVFPNYDVSSQLQAINESLQILLQWRNTVREEFERRAKLPVDRRGENHDDLQVDLLYMNIYRSAAFTQAAVGSLAPFLEGFLVHAFSYLRILHGDAVPSTKHPRGTWGARRFWNPKEGSAAKGAGLFKGIAELRDVLQLEHWLADSVLDSMHLLFTFRNRLLHFGYEWPHEEVSAFKKEVEERHWADFVDWATVGETPWIAHLRDEFLSDMLVSAGEVVRRYRAVAEAFGGKVSPMFGMPVYDPAAMNRT